MVLNRVERGELTGRQAAELVSLSVRQVRRLLAAYRREGVAALAHGNRGRCPVHALPEESRKRVVALVQGRYGGLNHYQLQELLEQREQLAVSRSSVWRILTAAGIPSPRRRRPPQHRCRRERYPQEGMLLQVDGSRHDWLEGRGPYLTLMGAIDDATGTVPYALFREQEDAQGYFLLLRKIIEKQGVPLALYSDRHSIFLVNPKQRESLEEQLAGERQPTQVGRALQELGVQSILARSPQAKGRIERLWGTFQDRLVSELRLAGARSIEEANKVLWDYLPRFNARFSVAAAQEGSAYRQPEPALPLEGVLCFKYQRTVARDNTVRLGEHTLQLLPGSKRSSYARARVQIQERLDGSLVVTYQNSIIAHRPAPPATPVLRARSIGVRLAPPSVSSQSVSLPITPTNGTKPRIPASDHPWRKPLMVTKS
ncbi:MAG: ISNCY family transposase [Chloroflexota bacterium]|nr:ISNCY family transposase [Chloroflexota bacterium]